MTNQQHARRISALGPGRLVACAASAAAASLGFLQIGAPLVAQSDARQRPLAVLEAAPHISFPSATDSNSPAYWRLFRGMPQLVVITSAPTPVISIGPTLDQLGVTAGTGFSSTAGGNRWIEAVLPDAVGRLFGYYHFEPFDHCDDGSKTAPSIGAARSFDGGRSWTDLGVVIGAPPGEINCDTTNRYFAGGVGDFSVVLDRNQNDLYFLFSTYGPDLAHQGVAVARMLWSHRMAPQGQVATWSAGAWRYPVPVDGGWAYAAPSPIFPARLSWHDRRGNVDAYWGPSVHWNTFLKRYVMLLNRATDSTWTQEGIYLSATATIEDPASWREPQKLVDGGVWYPQVIGLEPGFGTDRLAGERARFFLGGVSRYEIRFLEPEAVAVPRRRP